MLVVNSRELHSPPRLTLLEAGQSSIPDIRAIYKAEQIEQEHCRNDVQINLPSQPLFFLRVEDNKRIPVSVKRSNSAIFNTLPTYKRIPVGRCMSTLGCLLCCLLEVRVLVHRSCLLSNMWLPIHAEPTLTFAVLLETVVGTSCL